MVSQKSRTQLSNQTTTTTVITETQIKTIMRYYPTAVRMAITEKTKDSKYLHGHRVSLTPILSMKLLVLLRGFPGGSNSKESACNVGDLGLIPGLGGSPGEGNNYPLQNSGL